jgi:hypothetical protein
MSEQKTFSHRLIVADMADAICRVCDVCGSAPNVQQVRLSWLFPTRKGLEISCPNGPHELVDL